MKVNMEHFAESILWNKLEVYHIVARKCGQIVGEFHFRHDNRRDNIHSVSKSILSIGVGIAIEEGIIKLNEKPAEIFADKLPKNPSPYLFDITVRDMMMMATGHDQFILQGFNEKLDQPIRDVIPTDDWVKYSMEFDVPYKPGTYWKYNNFGPYLISVILQDRTEQRLVDWMKPRLFTPLGINNPQWFESSTGYALGCGGLHLSTEELSRFAQLLINKGCWDGKQLVPSTYIEEATACQISNKVGDDQQDPDSTSGYGYFFWRNARDNAYSGRGWGGQYIIMLPDHSASISLMSHDFNSQKLLDCIWEHIVPQLK